MFDLGWNMLMQRKGEEERGYVANDSGCGNNCCKGESVMAFRKGRRGKKERGVATKGRGVVNCWLSIANRQSHHY